MRVGHVNNSDRGGAARVAQMLIGVRAQGDVLFAAKTTRSDTRAFDPAPDPFLLAHCGGRGFFFGAFQGSHRLPQILRDFDVCHLHNIHGDYFNPFSLIPLAYAMPTVWTLHDMFALTGRCTHAYDCAQWQSGCTACGSFSDGITAACGYRHKELVYAQAPLTLAVPSQWLYGLVQKSMLNWLPVEHIPNGIEVDRFVPGDRTELRRRLGIGEKTVLIGSCAAGGVLGQEIKGGSFATVFMRALAARGIDAMFVNIGAATTDRRGDVVDVAFTDDPAELSAVYASLDCLVLFSKAETSSLVCMEAMSCGVVCAAFRATAIPEVISHGVTGVLAEPFDVDQLAAEVARVVSDKTLRARMSAAAREEALRSFDARRMVAAYERLYAAAKERFARVKIESGACRHVPEWVKTPAFCEAAESVGLFCGEPLAAADGDGRLAAAHRVYRCAVSGGDAVACAEKIVADNAPSSELEYLLGDALRIGGCLEAALRWFLRARKTHPRDISLLVGAGDCLFDMGRTDDACACAQAVLQVAPDDARVAAWADKMLAKEARI